MKKVMLHARVILKNVAVECLCSTYQLMNVTSELYGYGKCSVDIDLGLHRNKINTDKVSHSLYVLSLFTHFKMLAFD